MANRIQKVNRAASVQEERRLAWNNPTDRGGKFVSRFWKEPYTEAKARQLDIHYGNESHLLLGDSDTAWIYYVSICSFTFAFYSLDSIPRYIDYYSTKILPTRRARSIWVGEPQHLLNRLPLRLRSEAKRHRVVKALVQAQSEFRKQEGLDAASA